MNRIANVRMPQEMLCSFASAQLRTDSEENDFESCTDLPFIKEKKCKYSSLFGMWWRRAPHYSRSSFLPPRQRHKHAHDRGKNRTPHSRSMGRRFELVKGRSIVGGEGPACCCCSDSADIIRGRRCSNAAGHCPRGWSGIARRSLLRRSCHHRSWERSEGGRTRLCVGRGSR